MRIVAVRDSKNQKLGGMPATYGSKENCPVRCPLLNNGCYADYGPTGRVFRNVTEGRWGLEWPVFLDWVRSLGPGQLWRHNVSGDLAGSYGIVDTRKLFELRKAAAHTRGFTFTHYDVLGSSTEAAWNRAAVQEANRRGGLTINVSCETPEQADRARERGLPAVLAVKRDHPVTGARTPAGRPISVCPAEYRPEVTCRTCGLCARADRECVVAFRAHGTGAKKVERTLKELES